MAAQLVPSNRKPQSEWGLDEKRIKSIKSKVIKTVEVNQNIKLSKLIKILN